jgi:hypothetical protein
MHCIKSFEVNSRRCTFRSSSAAHKEVRGGGVNDPQLLRHSTCMGSPWLRCSGTRRVVPVGRNNGTGCPGLSLMSLASVFSFIGQLVIITLLTLYLHLHYHHSSLEIALRDEGHTIAPASAVAPTLSLALCVAQHLRNVACRRRSR